MTDAEPSGVRGHDPNVNLLKPREVALGAFKTLVRPRQARWPRPGLPRGTGLGSPRPRVVSAPAARPPGAKNQWARGSCPLGQLCFQALSLTRTAAEWEVFNLQKSRSIDRSCSPSFDGQACSRGTLAGPSCGPQALPWEDFPNHGTQIPKACVAPRHAGTLRSERIWTKPPGHAPETRLWSPVVFLCSALSAQTLQRHPSCSESKARC